MTGPAPRPRRGIMAAGVVRPDNARKERRSSIMVISDYGQTGRVPNAYSVGRFHRAGAGAGRPVAGTCP
ncbi:hypothetical protein SXCC_00760 [Gluconacetobacter sp. SXCC-1]|nr:hypothetical protein SXCC_00760 [Gluconacetobacter sp. SXCC-1]